MRLLDQQAIDYHIHVRHQLPPNHAPIYKTLVTQGQSEEYYVFVVEITHVLDMKRAAQVVEEKHIHMIKERHLLPITGYVHGGCSPIAMKKQFRTIIDESAKHYDTIMVSGGQVALSIELRPLDLAQLVSASFASVQIKET